MSPDPTPGWTKRAVADRSLWVIDGLVAPPLVALVHRVLADLPHYRRDYDSDDSKDILHLKHEWSLEKLGEHPALQAVRDPVVSAVERVYGEHRPVLDRAHANETVFGEILSPHVDLSPGVTAIYFANPEWDDGWEGEALFYADGEAVAAVAPRPGRVAMFPGDLIHRAGSPSRTCVTSRRTIAFKFTTSSPVP